MPAKPKTAARPAKARIFLVDDHPLLRKGIAESIRTEPDMIICGQATTALEAIPAIAQARPDVVIADISLPGCDGLELIKYIKAQHGDVVVLVYSMHDESLYAERILRAGARGYVMKSAPTEELIRAIRQVLAGEIAVSRQIINRALTRTARGSRAAGSSPIELLTDRELEVFRLLGKGMQRKEIAAQLHLSVKTIETHRANMCMKLGLQGSSALLHHAIEFFREEIAGQVGTRRAPCLVSSRPKSSPNISHVF